MKKFILVLSLPLLAWGQKTDGGMTAVSGATYNMSKSSVFSLPNYVTCLDFAGVDRTGVADSTAGLNNCINSMSISANNNYQGDVHIPDGTYSCTGTLSWGAVTAGKIIVEYGATLGCSLPAAAPPSLLIDDRSSSDVTVWGGLTIGAGAILGTPGSPSVINFYDASSPAPNPITLTVPSAVTPYTLLLPPAAATAKHGPLIDPAASGALAFGNPQGWRDFWCNSTLGQANATTYWLFPGAIGTSGANCQITGTANQAGMPVPVAANCGNLQAALGTAAVNSVDVIVYQAGAATSVKCTITAGQTVCSDTADVAAFAAGQGMSVAYVTHGSNETGATVRASLACY